MKLLSRRLLALIIITAASGLTVPAYTAQADETQRVVPTPSEFLGIDVGTDKVLADWNQIQSYFRAVGEATPRVSIVDMGKSTNGRAMIAAVISSEDNIASLDGLLQRQHDITYLTRKSDEASRWKDNKLFLLIDCSIHSSEIGASQMSLKLLHRLASGEGAEEQMWRDRLVVILIPSPNPDGIDMTVEWYRRWLGTEFEGSSPPYLYQEYAGHDNNRDWYMLNLPETQNINHWISNVWFPQIVWDAHQMGSNGYRAFIPPFDGPPNPMIHPLVMSGIENAGHAMKYQVLRDGFTGVGHSQGFTLWWNGGFRTVPYFKNSIGLLTELASARLATPTEVKQEDLSRGRGNSNYLQRSIENPAPWKGGTWSMPDIIALELSAAEGLMNHAARNSDLILGDYRSMSLDAIEAKEGGPAGYLLDRNQHDITALARLVDLFQAHGIAVNQLAGDVKIGDSEFHEGSIVIDGHQPFRPFIRSMLERLLYPAVKAADGTERRPYDLTAWTLTDLLGLEVRQVSAEEWQEAGLESKLAELQPVKASFVSYSTGQTIYPASASESYAEVNRIIAEGGYIHRSEDGGGDTPAAEEFVNYDPGHDASDRDISGDIEEAKKTSMRLPRLGLLRGFFNSIDEGWTRWLLEKFNFPYVSLDEKRVMKGSLVEEFDAIILPDMGEEQLLEGRTRGNFPEEYRAGIQLQGLQALESFVLDGGTLICMGQSSRTAIKRFELPVADLLRGVSPREFSIPGSLVWLESDKSNPYAFGMRERTAAMYDWSLAFDVPASRAEEVEVVARYAAKELLIGGFAKGEELIAGKAAMVVVKHGNGKVVLIGFPCQFRGQTYSTFKLLFNSIHMAGSADENNCSVTTESE